MKNFILFLFVVAVTTVSAETYFPRKIVMEEGTGTWCGWCVRGIEVIERMRTKYPDNFIAIALHTGSTDKMSNPENYSDLIARYTGVPGCFYNRSNSESNTVDLSVAERVITRLKDNGKALITAQAVFSLPDSSAITITTSTTFGFSGSGDWRIAYVLVEDSIGPYLQSNFYANNSSYNNPSNYMYEWVGKPSQILTMCKDVACGIYPTLNGKEGSLPLTVTEGETYKTHYTFRIPSNVRNRSHVKVVTLLIDHSTGEILNADEVPVKRDTNFDQHTFQLRYQNMALLNYSTITSNIEDATNCELTSIDRPFDGLVLEALEKESLSGEASIRIISNTLNAKTVEWGIGTTRIGIGGGETSQISFTLSSGSQLPVILNAAGPLTEGELSAQMVIHVDDYEESIEIHLVYDKHIQKIGDVRAGKNQLWWSNYSENNFTNHYFDNPIGTIRSAAIHVNKGELGPDTLTISAASIKIVDSNFKNLRLWLSYELPSSNLSDCLEVINVPNNSVNVRSLTEIPFTHDYLIPDQGIYIGYSYETTVNESHIAIGEDAMAKREGQTYYYTDKDGKWKTLSNHQLVMQLLLGNTYFPTYAITPTQFEKNHYFGSIGNEEQAIIYVRNEGRQPIYDFDYVVKTSNGLSSERHISLVTPISNYTQLSKVRVQLPAEVTIGTCNPSIVITKVNGIANPYIGTTVSTVFTTINRHPNSRAVVEEITKNKSSNASLGYVGMKRTKAEFGDSVIYISIHPYVGDPMNPVEYYYYPSRTGLSAPYCCINRGEGLNPYSGDCEYDGIYGFGEQVSQALNVTAPAEINAEASWCDNAKTSIDIHTSVIFMTDISDSPYLIGYALIADGLRGSGSEWAMGNAYSGIQINADFDEVSSWPESVTDMVYDNVAIGGWSTNTGVRNSLPSSVKAEQPVTHDYKIDVGNNNLIQDPDKLSIVALLIDKNTQRIVNAVRCPVLDVHSGISNIEMSNEATTGVYDLIGRKVRVDKTSMDDLPSGIYIVNGEKIIKK